MIWGELNEGLGNCKETSVGFLPNHSIGWDSLGPEFVSPKPSLQSHTHGMGSSFFLKSKESRNEGPAIETPCASSTLSLPCHVAPPNFTEWLCWSCLARFSLSHHWLQDREDGGGANVVPGCMPGLVTILLGNGPLSVKTSPGVWSQILLWPSPKIQVEKEPIIQSFWLRLIARF